MHCGARRADEHRVSDDTHDAEQDAVETALLLLVREVCYNEIRDGAECVAWNSENLHHGVGGTGHDGADDRRQESGEPVKHGVRSELSEAKGPDFPVLEAFAYIVPVELCGFLRVSCLSL